MTRLWVNDRIRQLEEERLDGVARAEEFILRRGADGEWDRIKDDFIDVTKRNFLTDYCQEQIRRYHRFDIRGEMFRCREVKLRGKDIDEIFIDESSKFKVTPADIAFLKNKRVFR